MNFKKINFNIFDSEFDKIYPERIQKLSHFHWTNIDVAKTAIEWLNVSKEDLVLDIGSGVGKFCCLGGLLTKGTFVGVEQRKDLHDIATEIADSLGLDNATFINQNILSIDFSFFDSFYYFNPFQEQWSPNQAIDQNYQYSRKNYQAYENYVHEQLSKLKVGTRIVTYCSDDFLLPGDYKMCDMMYEGLLTLWVKSK